MKYDLIEFKRNVYSQYGEDGILEKIFQELDINEGYFVEFGAGNGIDLSNTRYLYEKGWSGLMIEANELLYKDLEETYSKTDKVKTLNNFVSIFEEENKLDNILENNNVKEIDFISIDVDGNDYHIWESLKKYDPKVVMIECNFSFPFNVEFVQNFNQKIGNSPLSLYKLGKEKGYSMVCLNTINCFFVKNHLYPKIKDKLLNTSFSYLSVLGTGFSGLIASDYTGRWHSILDVLKFWGNSISLEATNLFLVNKSKKFRLVNNIDELRELFYEQN